MIWIDTIIQGVLLGGLYALFAAGLSLVFGIMRLVNLAHGDLIVFAAYLILLLVSLLAVVASHPIGLRRLRPRWISRWTCQWVVTLARPLVRPVGR